MATVSYLVNAGILLSSVYGK